MLWSQAGPLHVDSGVAAVVLGCGLLLATFMVLVTGRGDRGSPGTLLLLQLTAASCLCLGAGLATRGLLNLHEARPTTTTLAADLDLDFFRHRGAAGVISFRQRVLTELAARPEIGGAAFASHLPFDAPGCDCAVTVERGLAGRARRPSTPVRQIDPGFFRLVDAAILKGRDFTEADGPEAPGVAIVSVNFARQSWGTTGVIGRRLSFDDGRSWVTVVGVADDGSHNARLHHAGPAIYRPLLQDPELSLRLIVRPTGSLERATAALVEAVHAVDLQQPVIDVRTLAGAYDELLADSRARALLLGLFAVIALLAASLGISAAAGHAPARRSASGAGFEHALAVVKQASVSTLPALGLALLAASSAARTLWVAVEPTDPGTLLAVAALLVTAVALAAVLGERVRQT